MIRGGLERFGAAALVAGGLLVARDTVIANAGGCGEPHRDLFSTVKSTERYELIKLGLESPQCKTDPERSNVVRIISKTNFLDIPFLWTTSEGAKEALVVVMENCTLVDESLNPKKEITVYSAMDITIDDSACTDSLR